MFFEITFSHHILAKKTQDLRWNLVPLTYIILHWMINAQKRLSWDSLQNSSFLHLSRACKELHQVILQSK